MSARRRRRRCVAVVTGTRAEYGLLRSSMEAIRAHHDLHLQLVVTGMHLLRKFGHTVDEIEADGWRIDARVKMQHGTASAIDHAEGLSRGVSGIAKFLEANKSDIVLVLGDRVEALAGALAGVTTGRIVAHVHGGDLAEGDFDESFRHAITKLGHLHLAAAKSAAKRIVRMGEPVKRVVCVGAPGLDRLVELKRCIRRSSRPTGRAIVLHHPIGRAASAERRTMASILRVTKEAGLTRAIIYPNSDRGHDGVIAAIEAHRRGGHNGTVQVYRSVPREDFLKMLVQADVLVGNSSCGVIEAPLAGTRVINVGPRQDGRVRDRGAVVDAAETPEAIRQALAKTLRLGPISVRRSIYGDGKAGLRIATELARVSLDGTFRRKHNAY